MKKLALALAATAVALTACTTGNVQTGMNTGMGVLKVAVDGQCRYELASNKAYQVATVAMTAEQKQNLTTQVCDCVSEQASVNAPVTAVQAALDPAARKQIVAKMVADSLSVCSSHYLSKK